MGKDLDRGNNSSSKVRSPNTRKKTWERRLDEAKRKHRPKLKDWKKDNFGDKLASLSRNNDFNALRNEDALNQIRDITRPTATVMANMTTVDRISCRNLSLDEFIDFYERPEIPCVITGIPSAENWKANQKWHLSNKILFKRDLGPRYFKVGEDDDGYKVKVRMKYFLKYLRKNVDDSPLYVFDGNYDDDNVSKSILGDYKPPSYFPDDLFEIVGESRRPPYRWFLVGPERSGTCLHVDPLATSAWNTVIEGRKLWVLFPPSVSKSVAKGLDVIKKGEDDEAVNYFVDILPRIREKHKDAFNVIQFIQEPGDTVFVPGGWWHAVLNLENTVAITHNYCGRVNFDKVWRKTRTGRKKMAAKWMRLLKERHPTLGARAELLNEIDEFSMKYK